MPANSSAVPPRHLLVVDDEPMVRTTVLRFGEQLGCCVQAVADGASAVEIVRRSEVSFHVILLDLNMPDMDGLETFQRVRELDPTARIVLISGFAEQEACAPFRGLGLNGFLHKPFGLRELLAVLG